MMKMPQKSIYILILIISTLLVISSTNWLTMWVGLEMNLMAFIPLFSKSKNNFLSESTMIYFLIQSLASIIFIIAILMNNYLMMNMWSNNMLSYFLVMSMMMKMGMPPFHTWFPNLMNKLDWEMCFVLSTWQKVAPLYIISQTINSVNSMMYIIYLSIITGAILGLNQTSTRKIMAYSSINHLGWMMACILINKKLWVIYLMIYSMLMLVTFMMMWKYNILFINQFNLKNISMTDKLLFISLMLSIGGVPPLLGFMPKWLAIQAMMNSNEMVMLLIMVMSSLLTLSYYLRMLSPILLITTSGQKWMNIIFYKKKLMSTMLATHLLLPVLLLMVNLN